MSDFKKIIVCADDFGLNSGVSAGILKLVRMRRLSAVSCMVNTPDARDSAQELQQLAERVDIGLHFNLTEGSLLSDATQNFSLASLLWRTHLHCIAPSLIEREFTAQLDEFIHLMGRMPDFIDGHQHVHQFPQIRQVVLKLYEERLRAHNVAVRSTYPLSSVSSFRIKATVLAHTGGRALNRVLTQQKIRCNQYFAGIYDFSPATDYRALFQQWLRHSPDNTLIMCHPAQGLDNTDVIAAAREKEMAYLTSDAFFSGL